MDIEEVRKDVLEWANAKQTGEQVVFYVPVSERKGQKAGTKRNIILCIGKHPTDSMRLFVLKRDGPGSVSASKKRRCEIRDVLRLEMPEGTNPDHEVSVVLGDWSTSQKHVWKWYCGSHSELEHLVVNVANYFQTDVGKPLPVAGGRAMEYDFVGEEQKKIVREDTADNVEVSAEPEAATDEKEESGGNLMTEAEERDLTAMLKADMRMDEITKYRQGLVQELALLQDAHIHTTLSSTEHIKRLCAQLSGVASQASTLREEVARCDDATKGADNDLLALKSSSRRFHTLNLNQTKLATTAAAVSAGLRPSDAHARLLREAPLALDAAGRLPPDLLAALQALAALINDSLRRVPDELLHIAAVDESRTLLLDLRFSFVRRSVGHLQAEIQRGVRGVRHVTPSASPQFADMAGLGLLHRQLRSFFPLTERLAALDSKAREDLLDSYCTAVEQVARQHVQETVEWAKGHTQRRKLKEEGLAPRAAAVGVSDRWGETGSSWHSREEDVEGGGKAAAQMMWRHLLGVVQKTVAAEEQFLGGWLGVRGEEGGAELVQVGVGRVLHSVCGEVLAFASWLHKRDALVVPELMVEVDPALEKAQGGGQRVGGLWVSMLMEVQRSLRARLNRFIDEQVEVVMDARVSTKKAPTWTGKIGGVVRELDRAARGSLDGEEECEATLGQVDRAAERLLIGAMQALGRVAASDPKHGRSYMVMSLRSMLHSLEGGRGVGDAGPRAAVREVMAEARSMQRQQLEQYVRGVAGRELPRVLRASETVGRQQAEWEAGGAGASSGVVPISLSKTALQDAVRAELGGNLEKTLRKLLQRVGKDFHEDAGAVVMAWEEVGKYVQHKYEVLQQRLSSCALPTRLLFALLKHQMRQAALRWYQDELQPSASALKQMFNVVGRGT